MKKAIISILLIILTLSLSIPANCNDDVEDPVGIALFPTVEANGLEDFSAKLNSLKPYDIRTYYKSYRMPDIYEKVLERIDSGKDIVYIPDIEMRELKFSMYVKAFKGEQNYKYATTIHEGDEIGLDTSITFYYDDFCYEANDFYYAICDDCSEANMEIEMYGKKIKYSNAAIYFETNGDMLVICAPGNSDEFIRTLPRGLFYPKVLTIADIKNGEYPSDTIDLEADDPKESDNPDSI